MGYIRIDRKLFNNFLWKEKRMYSKFEAWLDLIQLVSYTHENEIIINNAMIKWNRGEFPCSITFLEARWKWTPQKVRGFIKLLEKQQMINKQITGRITVLTLCNYDKYNPEQQPDNIAPDAKATNPQHPDNNLTTVNKEKKVIKEKDKYKYILLSELSVSDGVEDEHLQITLSFQTLIAQNMADRKVKNTNVLNAKGKWVDPIRLLLTDDNYKKDDLLKVWHFLKTDIFWQKNILSTSKLREKFSTLLMNANEPGNKSGKDSEMDEYKRKLLRDANG